MRRLPPKIRPTAEHTADKLAPGQRAWLERYLEHGDATRAYSETHPKANQRTACGEGARLRRHPMIVPLIEAAQAAAKTAAARSLTRAAERYVHTQERVLMELHHIAYVDTAAASLKSVEEMTDAERRALKAIERSIVTARDGTRTERIRYVWHDKIAALKLIGIPLGMWTDSPPPPPPVPADQQPAAPDTDAKAEARRRLMARLDALAEPAPLEGEIIPPRRTNGTGQVH